MEQHPVPQHIASFEFKLFGNLTVRQFVTLAIPMAAAAFIFFSSLTSYVRIPLAGAIALFGLFSALVPVGGRPFDKWIVAFLKAVLSPTQRVWIKEEKLPQFLSVVIQTPQEEDQIPQTITVQGRERLRNYLRSLPKGDIGPLDVREQIAIQRLGLEPSMTVGGQQQGGQLPPPIIWPTSQRQPLFSQSSLPQINMTQPTSMAHTPPQKEEFEGAMEQSLPIITPVRETRHTRINAHAKPYALPGLEKKLKQKAKEEEETIEIAPLPQTHLASEANFTIENVIPISTPGNNFKLIHGIGKTRARKLHFAPPEGFDLSKLPIRGERRFEISDELKKRFSDTGDELFRQAEETLKTQTQQVIMPKRTDAIIEPVHKTESTPKPETPRSPQYIPKTKLTTKKAENVSMKEETKEILDSKMATNARKNGAPQPPQVVTGHAQMLPLTTTPNVISGIVETQDNMPMDKIILVIKDQNDIPIRALKTNKLGQFLSATPLPNGKFTVEVESQTHKFKPFMIETSGTVMEPLDVKPS